MTTNEKHIKDFWAAPRAQMNGENMIFIRVYAWLDVSSTIQKDSYRSTEDRQKINSGLVWWKNRELRILSKEPLKFRGIVHGVQLDKEGVERSKINRLAEKNSRNKRLVVSLRHKNNGVKRLEL